MLHGAALQGFPLLQSPTSFGSEKGGHLSGVTPLDVGALQAIPANRAFGFFTTIPFTYSHKPGDQP